MGTIQIDGSTPKLTIGNATAEDATILFDGNAQDFYIALDDSADDLLIGKGSTVGTTPAIAIDENLKVNIPVTTASTSASTGSLTTGGGAGIGADLYVGDDVYLITDSAVLGFGADKDTLLTHTDGTGLTLNSTNKLCFNDASQFIQGSSATVISIGATDEIDLTATAIDINGTADVSGTLTVAGNTSLNGGSFIFNEAGADLDFRIESDGNTHMLFVDGGNNEVGINASTCESTFHVISTGTNSAGKFESNSANAPMVELNNSRADDGSEISLRFTRADTVQGAIGTTGQGISFWTNSTLAQRMSIDSSGNIDIAGGYTTSGDAGISFEASGEMNVSRAGTSEQEMARFANDNGLIGTIKTSGSATSFNTSSDYRLKENETAITDGITRIKQLKPYRFNFKADADKTMDGFFAHEVSGIVPEAISGEKDAIEVEKDEDENDIIKPQGIDQSKLVPLLTSALQEAITKIETLETKVTALEA